jgi:alpha-1,2-mannosyltransferase
MAAGIRTATHGDAPMAGLGPAWKPQARSDWLLIGGIVAVAFLVRAVPVLRGGGLDGHLGYDDGVYFGAAVALVNGVLPYRDFLLLHPPGIAVLLSPFALLGGATDDATGFALARLAFMAIGAINAGLVVLAAGRYGRRAAVLGGLLYAVWFAAVRVERTTDLLGPQTALLLISVLLIWSGGGPLRARRAAAGGIALGLAAAIQVWAVIPLVVIAGTIALATDGSARARGRATIGLLTGAAAGLAAVCLPFFLAAPTAFIRYVLVDQLARPDLDITVVDRLRALEGFSIGSAGAHLVGDPAVIAFAIVATVAVLLVARRVSAARMCCVLLIAQVTYLLLSPTFYSHYSAWIAPAAAIILGIAAARVIGSAGRYRPVVRLAQVGYVGIIAALVIGIPRHQGVLLEQAGLERDLDGARCVSADAPDLLVVTSRLQRDIEDRCQLVIDPTGTSYETDRGHLRAGSVAAARLRAPGHQAAMEEYYDDSNAAMFTQDSADGLTTTTREEISDELPIVVAQGSVTIMLPGPTALP